MIRLISSIALMSLLSLAVFTDIFSSDSNPNKEFEHSEFVILECPADTMIMCTESSDPSNTGMATVSTGEMASFTDSIMLVCPNKIIRRTWTSSDNGTVTDTCIQLITLQIDTVINDFDPIVQFIGYCSADMDSLARAIIKLNCNEVLTNVVVLPTGEENCGNQQFFVTYNITDDCTQQLRTLNQAFQLIDIPPLTLNNIAIDSANVNDGRIVFDIMKCQDSDLTYEWSDGSTDSLLTNVISGDYSLTITSSVGCVDSFSFNVPQLGVIFLTCPVDITIGCDDDRTDTNLTGIAIGSAGERSFVDNIIQECPIMILERTWFLTSGTQTLDSCVQTITIENTAVATQDTLRFMSMCPDPIGSFVQNIALQCSEVLDSSSISLSSETCRDAIYSVSFFITDNCADSSYTRTQILEFTNIPFVTLSNTLIQPDGGDTTGSISFDVSQCRSSDLTFAWSNGSMDTTLMGLAAGSYTVTVSGGLSCVDSFSFIVPVILEDIICPADVSLRCDASIDPINLGFPMGGAPEDFTYTDSIIQECPATIIERTWIRNQTTASLDLCIQTIILDPQDVRSDFLDTVVVTGICAADLASFVNTNLPLSCGERIISFTTLPPISSSCDEVVYSTTWFGADDCNGSQAFTATQITIFREIPVAQLSNIMITPDPSGNGGAISFDASACKNDQLTYLWSTGSTATGLDSLNSGSYSVTITSEMGCEQVVDFTVPIFLSHTCPADITIGCDEEALPSLTGESQVTGFDSVTYFDIVIQDCPSRVTERRWVSSISGGSLDTCLQIITQVDDNLRNNFADSIFISGQCSGMLDSLVSMTLPLGCNERIDFVATDPISADCSREIYRTDWLIFDECTGQRNTLSQFTIFENIKVVEISNVVVSPAIGDTTGAISFDYTSCKGGTTTFLWSTGSTAESIIDVSAGNYSVTLTSTMGCEETLSFDVPLSFGLSCPPDIVVSCADDPLPSLTGMATLEGFDSLNFVDSIIQDCPNTIINRTWTGSSENAESVSCTQIITLSNENIRSDFQDTVRVTGACAMDLQSLIALAPPLRCGESINSQNISSSPMDCNTQTFQVDWFVLDVCDNITRLISQVTIFEDISIIDMTNLMITPDQEDSTGAISFDFNVCMGDTATFQWSNGSTDANLNNILGGTYGLTVTNSIGCIDTFTFEVPLLFSLNCPVNISVGCIQDPSTDVTGEPTITGYEILMVSDNITQMCPDQIIARTWTAMTLDSSMSESCTQIITLRSNISTIRENFPLQQTISGVCTEDALLNPETVIPLACSEILDSTEIMVVNRSCEQDVINFTWFIFDQCMDSSYSVTQTVIFNDIPVILIDSVDIVGVQGNQNGSINLSFTACGDDTISFVWNDLSTNPSLSDVPVGEYELRVTNEEGCRDTFNYVVPADFSVVCPADITIDCDASIDTANTGVPLTFGFMNITFSDSTIQNCPDKIIQRTWAAASGTNTDMCIQQITLMTNSGVRDNFADTITISGECPRDINMLVVNDIPLNCNEIVDSTTVVMISEECENAEFAVLWFITDACAGNAFSVTQTIMFDSIPFVTLENIAITRDNGMSSGAIDFDVTFCDNNALSFDWSDGSSNKSIIGVDGGIYMLTISNDLGCSEVFNFEVPSPLPFDSTKTITVDVVNRDSENFEGLAIRFLSNVGREELRADLFSEGGGRYIYVVEGELSEIGFICASFEDVAVRDVSSLDIVRGQRLILGISESCPEDFLAADVNFSGAPSAADLVLIRRIILGLDQNFPDNESWRFVKNEAIDINNLKADVPGCIFINQEDLQDQSIQLRGVKLGNLECPD